MKRSKYENIQKMSSRTHKKAGILELGCCDFTLGSFSNEAHASLCHQDEALEDYPDEILSYDRRVQVTLLDCVSSQKRVKRKLKPQRNISRQNASNKSTTWDILDKECSLVAKEVKADELSCGIYPEPCMSRFENFPCGSRSIVCTKEKIIFIMVWTVSPTDLSSSLTAIPVINNSGYDDRTVLSIIGEIAPVIKSTLKGKMEYPPYEDVMKHALILCEQMSACIASMETNIISMVSKKFIKIGGKEKELTIRERRQRSPTKRLKNGLRRFDMTPGESFDYFGLYEDTIQYELNNIYRTETKINKNKIDRDDCCPICLEDLGQNGLEFSSCGHKACPSCWRDLIKAAASSGDAVTYCPAYKCGNRIGIHDMAHIEFGLDAMKINERRPLEDSYQLLEGLLRCRIDNYVLTSSSSKQNLSGMYFCTTPNCNNVFVSKNNNFNGIDERSFDGSNIYFCACGNTRCGDCYQDSHLGLPCEQFSKVKKVLESDRIDAEMKSLIWVRTNTSPCPKCRFPINKNGGCNHIWCSKCEHYFCWICGGDGGSCGAFSCHNKGRVIEEDSSEEVSAHIDFLSEYRDDREKLDTSLRKVKNDESNKFVALEVQLRQTMLWTRLQLNSALLKNATKVRKDLLKAVERIELGVDVLMMRCHGEENHFRKLVERCLEHNSLKCITGKESKIFEKQYSIEDFINISTMLSMTFERFSAYSTTIIADVIGILKNGQAAKTRRMRSASQLFACSPLNEKAKREKHGWKSKLESLVDTDEDEMGIENEKKGRWKGKDRLKARRYHVLVTFVENL